MKCTFGLVALLLLAPAAAQVPVAQDPTGDLQGWTILTAPQPVPARFDAMDLVALSVQETPDTFEFTWQVADLQAPVEVPIVDDVRYIVHFQHNGQSYIIIVYRAHAEQNYYWGSLVKADFASNRFVFVRPFWNDEIRVDEAADSITVAVDRLDMADAMGAPPLPGRSIDNFWAFTNTRTSEGFIQLGNIGGNPISLGQQAGVNDSMPDVGNSTVSVPVTMGLAQSGDARLWSPSPFRARNGEAKTFAFDVRLEHNGDAAEVYELEATGAPGQWDVVVTEPIVAMEAGESRVVPVLVTTPFAHQHGAIEAFQITANGVQDSGNIGRLELGIRYHEVPQPAGHHPNLWIHSARFGEEHPLFVVSDNLFAGNSGNLYLNTLEDDPNDQGVPINGQYAGYGCHEACGPERPPMTRWQWFAFIQPGLEMGLDFDLDSEGLLSTSFRTDMTLGQAVVEGQFVYWRYLPHIDSWQRIEAAQIGPTDPMDIVAGQAFDIDFPFTMVEEADLLPYTKNSFFGMELNISSLPPDAFTGAEAPQFLGGRIDLPIFEYHDPVPPALLSAKDLLLHIGQPEKMVNPGKTVVFDVHVSNARDTAIDVTSFVDGVGSDLAVVMPPRTTIDAREDGTVQVAITALESMLDGDRIDLVVTVQGTNDPTLRSLGRIVAVVDTDAEHLDESGRLALGPPVHDAPVPLVILVGAVALAMVLRRRG